MEEDEDSATYNSESDETVTLSEIVMGKEVTLREEEVWALCRECCLTLEFVHSTQELFQSLVITPETVAFDRDGNVCFLDLDTDPDPLYIPPEYEEDGASYKSHLFSLGTTLLFAVEYATNDDNNNDDDDDSKSLSQDVRDLLTHLTQADPDSRPDLDLVLEYCERALQDVSSQDVCQRFACGASQGDLPRESGSSLRSMTEELAAYLNNQNGLVTPAQHSSCTAPSDSDSSRQASHSSSQHTHSSETRTQGSRNVTADSSGQERKGSGGANPTIPGMDVSQSEAGDDSSSASPRKNRRRQGLLLSDILSSLERDLLEAELWALCRECVISLQRKRKHLPAYISPDTVMVRDLGGVSFKAIPEDRPLEVVYMAPELQQKGILNEKTCMYGLGVTLRCTAGQREDGAGEDPELEDRVGPAFLELLTTLMDPDPDLRPSLEVCLMACDEFEKQGSRDSRLLCQEIYMDACVLNSSREPKKSEAASIDLEDSALLATELQTSWTELEEGDKEVFEEGEGGTGEENPTPSHPHPPQSFQPVAGKSQGSAAFKPVPFKPKPGRVETEDTTARPVLPSAFSSPNNYFKPIVLESTAVAAKADNPTGVTGGEEDKEKNVMQKLREIKKNLLKHRPPGNLAKDLEVGDAKPPVPAEKARTPRGTNSGRSSSRRSSGGGEGGVLESLLQQMQTSGQLPDTDNLAMAIAQHLQARLGPGGDAGPLPEGPRAWPQHCRGEAASDRTKASPWSSQHSAHSDRSKSLETSQLVATVSEPSSVEAAASGTKSSPSAVRTAPSDPQSVPAVPVMSQASGPSSLPLAAFGGGVGVGQGGGYMPMPVMPFTGGVVPGHVQYHIQQDPHTGLLQLVPLVPYPGPHAPGSDPPWPPAVSVGPGPGWGGPTDGEEGAPRPGTRPGVSSRAARGLIQKTAPQRARNTAGGEGGSPSGRLSDTDASPQPDHSPLPLTHCVPNNDGSTHRRSRSSGALECGESAPGGHSQQEYPLTLPEHKARPSDRSVCDSKSPGVHRSSSQSPSPSPSKDSGICLTQGGSGAAVSSAGLTERPVSSDSVRHRHTVTQVLHILQHALGHQGPQSVHSQDMLAEYVVSLAPLKWATFCSAVREKFPHTVWSSAVREKFPHTVWTPGLLEDLFQAVNTPPSDPARPAVQAQPAGREHRDLSGEDGLVRSQNCRLHQPHRKPAKPALPGGDHPQGPAEMTQRPEDTWSKQRPRQEHGPSSGKGTEADDSHSVVRVLANGRYVSGPSETSDSTDTEHEEKRRRFKKRYELDRSKGGSGPSGSGTAAFSPSADQGGGGADRGVQGEDGWRGRHASGHRTHGHAPPDLSGHEARGSNPFTDRGEVEATAPDRLRSDADSGKMSAPGRYHSLPRSRPSHHRPHDGASPSQSPSSGLPPPHRAPPYSHPHHAHPDMPPHAPHREGPSYSHLSPDIGPHAPHREGPPYGHLSPDIGPHAPHREGPTHGHLSPDIGPHAPHREGPTHGHLSPDMPPHAPLPAQSPYGATPQPQWPQWHLQPSASVAGTYVLQRPESREVGGCGGGASPQERVRLNSSTNSSSHSPAFSHSARTSAGRQPPDPSHRSAHGEPDSQGFVYGQLREPAGKPPVTASPCVTRSLRTAHTPTQHTDHTPTPHTPASHTDQRNSVPVSAPHHPPEASRHSLPALGSQGQPEVNAPEAGAGEHVARGSKPSSPRNRERSPVRKTQHAAKPRLAWDREVAEYRKTGQAVYHSAMIQLSMTPEVDRFIHSVDERCRPAIEGKLSSVEQEVSVLRRQRRKSQAFYRRLTDPPANQNKGESKGVVSQVLKDMSEMTSKLRYLDLCRTHLQMLLSELQGVDVRCLHSLATSGGGVGGRGEEDPPPLTLQRCAADQWLQFHTVREGGVEVQVLQAGHPQGLMAYLFTQSALSDGYLHQFLFCFRYFLRAEDVFSFITHTYLAARRGNQNDPDLARTQRRALDLLQFWVEGYYSLDFERNDALLDRLEAFIMTRVGEGVEGSQNLMNLLYACHLGENTELLRQADDCGDQDEVYYLHLASPTRTQAEELMEWESFRSLIGRRSKADNSVKGGRGEERGVGVERRPPSRAGDGSTMTLSRRTDLTHLMDYSPHRLAEQLTLMEQDLFQRTHPVHYLDSKSQGIGVDLSIPSLRTPSMARKAKPGSQSLFVGATLFEPRISELIAHSQEITHWVSAEILCCGSQKSQVAALSKFVQTAQLCVDIGNHATALAVLAGLDSLLVRQLPAWKHLPAKTATLMDHLDHTQVRLKGEPMALMQNKESHIYPTIPCILYFLLHLQQLEIGGFTLANGMYRWHKMRSISQMIDQIRIFREHQYGFEPDYELQSLICRRLHELSDRDLHSVAAAHDNNFRRVISHATGIQGTWRKVKVKLHSRKK